VADASSAPARTWSTVTCGCGHAERIDPDRIYHTIPTGRARWQVDPATSTVSLADEYGYICDTCWEALPDE
jgi:hypothetical protein